MKHDISIGNYRYWKHEDVLFNIRFWNKIPIEMKSTKVQTLGARAVAGAWLAG